MKQTAIILIVLGTFITGNPSAGADSGNPFGFETNKHPLEYEYCKKEPGLFRGHGYKCSSAPRPHPDLEEYALQFVEDVGLCSIVAAREDRFIGIMEMFHLQIAKKYGLPTTREMGIPPFATRISTFVEAILYQWLPSESLGARRERANKAVTDGQTAIADIHQYLRANKAISDAKKLIGIIKRELENHESVPVELRSVEDEGEIVQLRRRLVHNQDVFDRASRDIREFWADPREAGFKRLGDVKTIELKSIGNGIRLAFWLVTSDACLKKIDDKAGHAF